MFFQSDGGMWFHLEWIHESALDNFSKAETLMLLKGERLANPESSRPQR